MHEVKHIHFGKQIGLFVNAYKRRIRRGNGQSLLKSKLTKKLVPLFNSLSSQIFPFCNST